MGFFSWKTSDTNRSIANRYSTRSTFPVYMITEDGRVWEEPDYDGYGVFGGKDIFELIAELNGVASDTLENSRKAGIDLVHADNGSGDFDIAAARGVKLPKLVEKKTSKYSSVPYPKNCREQGFFYDDGHEEDSW